MDTLHSRVPETPNPAPKAALHAGHRARLRERFLRGGLDSMLDYEVLELVLSMLIPRRDVKPLAKELIARFGSVAQAMEAPREKLLEVDGIGETIATQIAILHSFAGYCLEERCRRSGNLLNDAGKVYDFVRMKMGAKVHESYMMIYLDSAKRLIDYRVIAEGSVDHVFAYARNCAEYALELHATAAVMVHNHPSALCSPSQEDMDATRDIAASLSTVGVELLDHLIVSRSECFSLVQHGLMTPGYGGAKKGMK